MNAPDKHPAGAPGRDAKDPAHIRVVEHRSTGYAQRTKHNADSAGLTVAIAIDFSTAGERLTARVSQGKYLAIPIQLSHDKAGLRLAKTMREYGTTTLNVAGNGIYTLARSGWTQDLVNQHVHDTIAVAHALLPIAQIVTGGQTGVDIAGAIAAHKLGIPTIVTMPAGYKQRGPDGVDYYGTAQSVTRQITDGAAALVASGEPGTPQDSESCSTTREALDRASTPTSIAKELFERLEELVEYSEHIRGSSVHKRCLDVLHKARPSLGAGR